MCERMDYNTMICEFGKKKKATTPDDEVVALRWTESIHVRLRILSPSLNSRLLSSFWTHGM